jgi:hypothetical protein
VATMDETKLLFLALVALGSSLRHQLRDLPLPPTYKRVTQKLAAELGIELVESTNFEELAEAIVAQIERELWPGGDNGG